MLFRRGAVVIVESDAVAWLRTLADGSVDLVATDPPYNTGNDFGEFTDKHDDYIGFMREFAVECRRVLAPTGILSVQCDRRSDAQLRVLLDDVFGYTNFMNAITWRRSTSLQTSQFPPKRFPATTDQIIVYAMSAKSRLKPWRTPAAHEVDLLFPYTSADGRRYNWNGHLGMSGSNLRGRTRSPALFEWRGQPPPRFGWALTREKLDALYAAGDIVDDGRRLKRRCYMRAEGVMVGDLWDDIPPALGNERVGYPTQKPAALYERIVRASSNVGDLVVDPFCGSGTTLLAAKRLGRRWAGCDLNPRAVALANRRVGEILC